MTALPRFLNYTFSILSSKSFAQVGTSSHHYLHCKWCISWYSYDNLWHKAKWYSLNWHRKEWNLWEEHFWDLSIAI